MNKDEIKLYNKNYFQNNKEELYKKIKKSYKTDINFRLICKTRNRIRQALGGKIKSSSTTNMLNIDIETYRKWIKIRFTPEMTWDSIEIDHVKAICMFDVSKEEELKEAFSWKETQPLLKQNHQQKGKKFNFLDYQLQIIKAYQFLKLNEEGVN